MRKIFFPAGGQAGIAEAAVPVPGRGQLLVSTEAVGVGVGLVRMLAAGDEVRPGGEMVGTVVAVGPDVAGFEIGDRVGGVVFEDVYADIVLADPRLVSHVPAEADAATALALVRGGLIALSTLRAGRVEPGESVLVTAAASGAGHLAGGDLVQRGVDTLAPFGRLVAFSAGGGTVDAGSLLGGLKSVIGFSIGLVSRIRPDLVTQRRSELWDLLAAGRLDPRYVDFPLEEISKAIDLVTSRSNLGRVVLRTR